MAELDIGLHCSLQECQQLDFLPFKCDGCSQIFCLDHKGRTAHSCSDINFKKEEKTSAQQPRYKCTFHNCVETELVPVKCSLCEKQFCLTHRLPEDHDCQSKKSNTSAKGKVQIPKVFPTELNRQQIPAKKKPLSVKNQKMAAKVSLMKLKQKAVGDKGIPEEERTYFSVQIPSNRESEIFVSCKWTFGKLIDELAKANNLSNLNNVSLENRLRLRNLHSQEVLDLSSVIKDALELNLIFSGSNLELFYAA